MNQWIFVTAAYALALTATFGLLLWAYSTMRKAEAAVEEGFDAIGFLAEAEAFEQCAAAGVVGAGGRDQSV